MILSVANFSARLVLFLLLIGYGGVSFALGVVLPRLLLPAAFMRRAREAYRASLAISAP